MVVEQTNQHSHPEDVIHKLRVRELRLIARRAETGKFLFRYGLSLRSGPGQLSVLAQRPGGGAVLQWTLPLRSDGGCLRWQCSRQK